MNDPLDKNSKETKEKQTKLREIQLKRDNGNTYGHDYKDPCKKVSLCKILSRWAVNKTILT